MDNQNISQCEIVSKTDVPKRKYTRRVVSEQEKQLKKDLETARLRIKYLESKYTQIDADHLAARSKLVHRNGKPVKCTQIGGWRWVCDEDVIDYVAHMWQCHPSNRMFRQFLDLRNVYACIQEEMRLGNWLKVVAHAQWVREHGAWHHPPTINPDVYDEAVMLAGLKRSFRVVGGFGGRRLA